MPPSDFLAWLGTATLRFFSLAEQRHTQIFYLGWAVSYSHIWPIMWLDIFVKILFFMVYYVFLVKHKPMLHLILFIIFHFRLFSEDYVHIIYQTNLKAYNRHMVQAHKEGI